MSYVTAGDFADDQRVTDQVVVQQPSESGRIRPKVIDPYGGVDQDGND